MTTVRLETKEGKFVATGVMLQFSNWPEVVLWGSRVFQLVTAQKEGEETTYREAPCIAIAKTLKPGEN